MGALQNSTDSSLMTDPTELVIVGSFVVAFGVFVISAIVRSVFAGRRQTVAGEDCKLMDGIPLDQVPDERFPSSAVSPSGRVPVWFYRPADLAGAGFVFLVFGWLFSATLGVPEQPMVLNWRALLVNIGLQFFIAGVVMVFAMSRMDLNGWLGLRWPSWRRVFLIAPGAVGFMWALFAGIQACGYMEWMESLGVETVQETVKLLQESEDPLILGLMTAAAVIVAPLCEEIVFRGYFYPVLKKFGGAWPAAVCSSLVFAAAHGSLASLLPLFLFGGLLVFIYEKTGSIWAPIAVHFCFNGVTVIVQLLARYYDFPLSPAP
jgi:membrane protease YdiL (CAAX protease family)